MPEPVFVIDLDGTVLHGNSYRSWVRHLLFGPFAHLTFPERWLVRLRTALLLIARKALRWRHARVKGGLRQIWADAVRPDPQARDLGLLLARLNADVRPWFRPILDRAAAGGIEAIAATAAAGEYAVPFARQLGFSQILATDSAPSLCEENLGVTKAQGVATLVQSRGWQGRPLLVFTDHLDDLPLIGMGAGLVWFGGSADQKVVAQIVPGLRMVSAELLSASDVLARMDAGELL